MGDNIPPFDKAAYDAFLLTPDGIFRVPADRLRDVIEALSEGPSLADLLAAALVTKPRAPRYGDQRVKMHRLADHYVRDVLAGGDPVALRPRPGTCDQNQKTVFSRELKACVIKAAEGLADLVFEVQGVSEKAYQELRDRILILACPSRYDRGQPTRPEADPSQ